MAPSTDRVEIGGVAVSPDHYIGGRRVASRHRFDVRSAVDGRHLADVAAGAADEGDQAVAAPQRAFPACRALGPGGRYEPLMRLAAAITRHVPDIAIVESTNNGSSHE